MTRDLLRAASKALSESGHEQRGARFTRERLMASLHERKRRSRIRFAVLLPFAAIFVGSTAFAAVTGQLRGLVLSALDIVGVVPTQAVEVDRPALPAHPPASSGTATPSNSPAVALGQAPGVEPRADASPSLEETSLPPPSQRPPPVVAPLPTAAPRQAKPSARELPSVAEDDGHAVYRRAHEAHFRQGDPAAALDAYGQYLAQHPSGRFSVDARYNRALCLVRLGRAAEAHDTLEAFAKGGYGGYRQADAQRLLGALAAE